MQRRICFGTLALALFGLAACGGGGGGGDSTPATTITGVSLGITVNEPATLAVDGASTGASAESSHDITTAISDPGTDAATTTISQDLTLTDRAGNTSDYTLVLTINPD